VYLTLILGLPLLVYFASYSLERLVLVLELSVLVCLDLSLVFSFPARLGSVVVVYELPVLVYTSYPVRFGPVMLVCELPVVGSLVFGPLGLVGLVGLPICVICVVLVVSVVVGFGWVCVAAVVVVFGFGRGWLGFPVIGLRVLFVLVVAIVVMVTVVDVLVRVVVVRVLVAIGHMGRVVLVVGEEMAGGERE
jgi:hypothetical protein